MAEATLEKSPMVEEEEKEVVLIPEYNEEEKLYLSNLQKRLNDSKLNREQPRPEFDDMTYEQYWQKNEDLANTRIKPKINKQDVQYQSGTLRTKLFAFLSSLQGLNLAGDISAFDENDLVITSLGNAMEDIIEKADEIDEDEEKKMLRQYEMLKQGTVFVEEIWEDKWIIEKQPIEDYDGQFRGIKIKQKSNKVPGKAHRNIISGLSVYLGDLTKYLISEQPYIYTVQSMRYDLAEQIYGKFDMWKYVSKSFKAFTGTEDSNMTMNNWRLIGNRKGMVEIVKYQDKVNKEYQIVINGIPMLPIGFPFPWGYEEYNIAQQNLKPIRHDFAYGKSFIFENKNNIQLLDEMTKLALLKTQKSFLPPYLNVSGRVISSKVLMPATISMGIQPNTLIPINDKETQGVTNAEFNMMQELIKNIDQNTASQTFTGQNEGNDVTATQIIQLQRQARIMMGTLIVAASLLEKKLIDLRLMSVLKNWFDPLDSVVDNARKALKERYRITTRMRSIEDEGTGMRMVIPTEEVPSSEEIKNQEDEMKQRMGMPVRIIALNPKELAQAKITWMITVNPKEKRSSDMSKLMFRAEMQDAMALGLIPKKSFVEEKFASVWEEDPNKFFDRTQPVMPPMNSSAIAPGVVPPGGNQASPTLKMPQISVKPTSNEGIL